MRLFCIFLCFLITSVASAEEWDVMIRVEGTDPSVYRDYYNKAGVKDSGCSFQCDAWDVLEMIPPEAEYLILYFPHGDIGSPHYWPACPGDYTYDRRPPTFAENIWRTRVRSTYSRELEVRVWWRDIETLPCYHSFWLKDLATEERINLRSVSEYIFNLPARASKDFDLIIKRGAIERIEISPNTVGLRVGEYITFSVYLYESGGDSFPVPASFELIGGDSVGVILPDGAFMAVREGEGELVARYTDCWIDTARVWVESTSITSPVGFELGWNMISLPVMPYDLSLSTLFPSAIDAYWWSTEERRYFSTDSIKVDNGYFILSLADTTYRIRGIPRVEFEYVAGGGWFMLPALSDTVAVDELEMDPAENFMPPLYWYSPDSRRYESSDILLPGRAYWALFLGETNIYYTTRR